MALGRDLVLAIHDQVRKLVALQVVTRQLFALSRDRILELEALEGNEISQDRRYR